MSADNYLITDQNAVYFLTFTVTDRIDTRQTGRKLKVGRWNDRGCKPENSLTFGTNEGQVEYFITHKLL